MQSSKISNSIQWTCRLQFYESDSFLSIAAYAQEKRPGGTLIKRQQKSHKPAACGEYIS